MTDPTSRPYGVGGEPPQFGHPSSWPQQQQPGYAPPAPPRPRRRGVSPLRIVLLVAAIALVLGGAGIAYSAVTGKGPAATVFEDSGVAACKTIRDNAAAEKANPSPTPSASQNSPEALKAFRQFRQQFADSRYADLRTAGTEAMDLIYQLSGSSGDKEADAGLALVAVGQLVQKWSSLAGACAAHGVEIPKITEMSN